MANESGEADELMLWRSWIAQLIAERVVLRGFFHLDINLIQDRQGRALFDIDKLGEEVGCKAQVGTLIVTFTQCR